MSSSVDLVLAKYSAPQAAGSRPAALDVDATALNGAIDLRVYGLHWANQPREEGRSDAGIQLSTPRAVGE